MSTAQKALERRPPDYERGLPAAEETEKLLFGLVLLGALGFGFSAGIALTALTGLVAALTLLSVVFYVAEWMRHMNAAESR